MFSHARLNEAQAGIKIAGRNINNLRYADDAVLPDVLIPEREERRLPRQCNSQKKGSLLLTRIRAPAARPTQW